MTLEPSRPRRLSPRVRLILARIIVVIGSLVALFALVTARWGFLFVGIIVIGLGAAMGPARHRG
jgi:hypothetical protein